jgi:hypothetical protein
MNLALPQGVRQSAKEGAIKISVQRLEQDVVGGSLISLGVRQVGESEFVAPLVSMGGLTRVEYVAAMLLGSGVFPVDKALDTAEEMLSRAKKRRDEE